MEYPKRRLDDSTARGSTARCNDRPAQRAWISLRAAWSFVSPLLTWGRELPHLGRADSFLSDHDSGAVHVLREVLQDEVLVDLGGDKSRSARGAPAGSFQEIARKLDDSMKAGGNPITRLLRSCLAPPAPCGLSVSGPGAHQRLGDQRGPADPGGGLSHFRAPL